MLMRKARARTIWTLAFLMAGFAAGCGREQAASPAAPLVISTVAANGATGVPVAQAITALFNEAMNATTLTTTSFTVTGPGAATVTGTVTYAGTTATFTPAASLAASTLYTATITTGAQNTIGIPLASNYVWKFTTGTIPTVVSTNPLNGAITVPINQKIAATFSEAMNSATIIAPATFTLAVAGVGGAAVPGTVTYVAATDTATFAPTVNLLPSTQYTATIKTSAESAAGNFLASNYAWSFTTGLTPNITPPTVTITVPASAATGVSTNQQITATFSEVMDPATIVAPGTFTVAVAGVGGASVAGTVSYAGSIATFAPTANLAPSTQFTATITNAAKDLSGNALIAFPILGALQPASAPTPHRLRSL
jgi:Bacterial Ig-like domain